MRKPGAQTAGDQSSNGGIHGRAHLHRRGDQRLEETAPCPKIASPPGLHNRGQPRISSAPSKARRDRVRAMASSKVLLLPLLLLAAASPAALAAFDVLRMLADKPAYAAFSKLLAQTRVAEEANRMRTASLLAVTDKAVQSLAALPADKQRMAVANHVLLNYFDPIKLDEMKTRTALLATMLSATDKALGQVNYTKADDGQMYFGTPGAPCVAKLIKVVAARPYSVSIMEVSEPILPAGFADPVAAPGRRAKGGKGKIKPSAAGLEDGGAAGATAAAPSAAP